MGLLKPVVEWGTLMAKLRLLASAQESRRSR
jgi:hypothetical protein